MRGAGSWTPRAQRTNLKGVTTFGDKAADREHHEESSALRDERDETGEAQQQDEDEESFFDKASHTIDEQVESFKHSIDEAIERFREFRTRFTSTDMDDENGTVASKQERVSGRHSGGTAS